ncbi:outer membrane beta-barrel family protein [Proteiniphilum acetatigenes]|uniref:outer membrane beta-barrel family protein n=1 Tax=Proteiniphilum acetatigenes TaxID=294710 RepID=UPI00037E5C6C|nr:outer membrane beta-barrel family protein [Proteiniphilum acetatigenes]
MKTIILIYLTFCSLLSLNAQLNGTVKDQNDDPVEFANIALYSLPDSSLVSGTTTNSEGKFSLISENSANEFLKISFIGYETKTVAAIPEQIIVLKAETTQLEEVTVTAVRPSFKMDSDGLSANIENTLLSRLGTANEVLAQLPFVSGEDGTFSIFGRGEPLIYINNRLVRDKNELRRLKSSDIKDVKVILNPGAQFDATVGAVIRITTVKAVGEGLSGSLYSFIRQRSRFDHNESIQLNYRKSGLDIFGGLEFSQYNSYQKQKNTIQLQAEQLHTIAQELEMNTKTTKDWSMNAGFNYNISPEHTFGIRYNHDRSFGNIFTMSGISQHFTDGVNDRNMDMYTWNGGENHRHYLNTYYNGKLNEETELRFEGDWLNGGNETPIYTTNTDKQSNETTQVDSENSNNYFLYAGKLMLTTPLFSGKITVGTETSYTENDQEYRMLNEEVAEDLPSNDNRSEQTLAAGFLFYDRTWELLSLQAGLRYEYIDFNYYYMGERSDEQSRKYNNVLPSVSLGYKGETVNMSLSYRSTVRRPSYGQLRSSIMYIDPYTYEGGNPALRPLFTSRVSYLFGWKNLNVDLSYNWYKDNIIITLEQFQDKAMLLAQPKNIAHSGAFQGSLSYSPTIAWWKPNAELGVIIQDLTYKGETYNRPYWHYRLNNTFTLPHNYILMVNLLGNRPGNTDLISAHSNFRTDIRLNKKIFNDALNMTVAFTDVFNTEREQWELFLDNVSFWKWNNRDSRGVYLQLTYTFNPARNAYKGQGAAGSELDRL